MKLHLVLLASVFNLSSGFMAELKGTLAEEVCTGGEYADFKSCVTLGAAADPILPVLNSTYDLSFVNNEGEDRKLNWCSGCTGGAPRGTFCFTVCGGRRRLEEGADTSNLRRVQVADSVVFEGGTYTGDDEPKQIAEDIIECLGVSHPCLGSTDSMILTVTL